MARDMSPMVKAQMASTKPIWDSEAGTRSVRRSRRMQRYLLHTRTSRRPQNCFIVGLLGLLSEENVPVASREQLVGLLPGSESDAWCVAMQGAIEEFRELADALRNACPKGQGPEHALRAEPKLSPPGFLEKALNVAV